ncbi:MAG: DUF4097 family beta strand repeat protein [Verrucomicrobiales bacterium]|nr:DUF4097 family beta strand repeat protein [Verrucomicrobiales bacterium]
MKPQPYLPPATRLLGAGGLAFALALGALLGTSTGCTRSQAADDDTDVAIPPVHLNRTFTVAPGGKLVMDLDRGAIDIRTSDRPEVAITVDREVRRTSEKKARQLLAAHQISFEQQGNTVTVHARLDSSLKSWRNWGSGLQVRYTVTLPAQFDLDLKTAGGSITVPDLTGTVLASTSGGSLKLGAIQGPVTCRTSGGSISVKSASQPADLRTSGGNVTIEIAKAAAKLSTSGGSIRVDSAYGPLEADTSGGNIDIRDAHAAVDASTSGGSVSARLAADQTGGCRLSTSGGNVRLTVPREIHADIDARTSGGSVNTDLPITVQGTVKRNELVGRIGEGGRLLRLRTSGGSIHLTQN